MPQAKLPKQVSSNIAVTHCQPEIAIFLRSLCLAKIPLSWPSYYRQAITPLRWIAPKPVEHTSLLQLNSGQYAGIPPALQPELVPGTDRRPWRKSPGHSECMTGSHPPN